MLTRTSAGADPDAMDESELVEQARVGRESAIRELIRRNNQRLFRAVRSVLRDDAEAEDAVQAAYVSAFTKLESFRGQSQFSTWLMRIALNEAFGRLRRRHPNAELAALDAAVSADPGLVTLFPLSIVPPPADSETDRTQMRNLLESAIDGLPEGFRVVFVLRDVEGLSTEEVGSQLGLKPETVKTRLHRARRLLRTVIEERMRGSFAELYPFDGKRCAMLADRVVAQLGR